MNPSQPLHVLIVEDDAHLAELLSLKMRRSQAALFQVTTTDRLGGAMEKLRTQPVDVVLLDLELPDSAGFDTFARLHAEAPDTPVIILSSSDPDAEQLALRTVRHGAQDYLAKRDVHAAGIDLLLRAIQYAIERKRTQRELQAAYDQLEKRVAERTAELVRANEKLQREISERQRAENALLESNRRLAEAIEQVRHMQEQIVQRERLHAIGSMASGIAHDFNNALTPMIGFSERLLVRPELLADRQTALDYLKRIHTAAKDSAKVVARLRDFYRSREETDTRAPVDLNALVREVILLTQPRWKDQALAAGVTIRIATELREIPEISANETELREMLTNLIFNAVDAIPQSGTITLRTFARDGSVFIEVADNGTGMSNEVRARCIEPFFSTKSDRGSGLGLGIVYGIVRRHEGELQIQSELGKGTTVSISLPVKQNENPAPAPPAQKTSPQALRLLVVEDDELVRELLTDYLREDKHEIVTAEDGADGLEKFRAGKFDAVLTDHTMPEMNGDQLAGEIKKLNPKIPVILLTGYGDLMSASHKQPAGVDAVLSKPFTHATLREGLSQALAMYRTESPGI